MSKMSGRILFAFALLLIAAIPAAAQPTVFVVRHAERADDGGGQTMMAKDPELSKAGHARAEALAYMLRDAGITTIITTPYRRTRQTAEPLAKALGVEITTMEARETDRLLAVVREATGSVLVVGHSNTVPGILKELGVTAEVTLGDSDYDNLFIVTPGQPPVLVRLHFR